MPLVNASCPNCGAALPVDSTKDAAICSYCGTPFIVEKAINNYNITNNISAGVVNIYGGAADFEIRAGVLVKYNGAADRVVIPESVKCIGTDAFKSCSGLISVEIPGSVKTIKSYAFRACTNLEKVKLHPGLLTIETAAFSMCKSLRHMDLPDTLETLYPAFQGCISLRELTIPASVKGRCTPTYSSSIEKLSFLGENIEFLDCQGSLVLKTVAVPNGCAYAKFSGCSALESVTLPDSIRAIGSNMFADCVKLRQVNIPAGVTEIGARAFGNCRSLTELELPAGLQAVDENAFIGSGIKAAPAPQAQTQTQQTAPDGAALLRSRGLCQHCGGKFSLFKKCKACGRPKDY